MMSRDHPNPRREISVMDVDVFDIVLFEAQREVNSEPRVQHCAKAARGPFLTLEQSAAEELLQQGKLLEAQPSCAEHERPRQRLQEESLAGKSLQVIVEPRSNAPSAAG